ncbi:TerD family protein [Mucilaginibacter daejeonensis]|uniref:TerD family protein n=1 Tax=Mucilaginibacter daejeonensis TaxID=398049 RepID=UPI001D177AF1|nr:TerD family protein [Mucilaginibacter daejeonensis]UEG51453.1 TerD family protein [Mucilaginibacter daejeonensis]
MAIQLKKKSPLSLEKQRPGLHRITAGLAWDTAKVNGFPVDLDLSIFLLGADGKLGRDENFVFYNNPASPDGAVIYPGDSRDGAGEGDDEAIHVELSKIDTNVEFLYLAVTIDASEERQHHFGHVKNASIYIRNTDDDTVLCEYALNEHFSKEDSLVVASISRSGGFWEVEALGQAFNGGLATLVDLYQ